jgi:hypothetical protein
MKTLKQLHVSEYKKLAMQIHTNFGDNVYKYFPNKKDLMVGGGEKTTEFDFKGTTFNFYKSHIDQTVHFHLFQNNKYNKRPECLYIIVDEDDKVVTLDGITYGDKCFTSDNKKKLKYTSGSVLLDVALKFMIKLKKHYKLKYCTLIDNSTKDCGNIRINLALMYTLMNGDTWYGSRGFVPKYDCRYDAIHEYKTDEQLYEMYKNNKKIMANMYVKFVPQLKKHLLDAYDKIKPENTSRKKMEKLYDENIDMKLSEFIRFFLIDYDGMCLMFNQFYIKLATEIGIYDFRGKPFILYF